MLLSFIKGIIIGLITGAPLGPVGILCLRTTLTNGAVYGLLSGLGSAVADSLYGFVAAFGVTFISRVLTHHQNYIRMFGAIVIVILGIRIFFSKEEKEALPLSGKNLLKSFFATFFLAISNPATVFSFLIIFASYGTKHMGSNNLARVVLVLGVFTGSALWWVVLVTAASLFRESITHKHMRLLNKTLGSITACLGIVIIINLTFHPRFGHPSMLHLKAFEYFTHVKLSKWHFK
jgi:threonine/homoserine/homoserine lactone efflux protein